MCVRGRASLRDTHSCFREIEAWLSQGCTIFGEEKSLISLSLLGRLWGKKLREESLSLLARESCPRNSSILVNSLEELE